MNDKVIGIIGGMGPQATADFYMNLIKKTNAKRDQDHFRVIIDSNVKIPDRTEAILHNGESPVKAMVETAKNLEMLGVDVGCIPCMTAHYFIKDIEREVSYPIINAFVEVKKHICEFYPKIKNIGVLATTGTIKTGLFEKYLINANVIYPKDATQKEKVMEAIYGSEGIKSGVTEGKPVQLLEEAANELIDKGAELIILGCTEIGLVLKHEYMGIPLIDPMEIIIDTLITG